ncbi:MAG: EI24 domain-containing protein [Candidatus Pseudobacter hemicellulosilyticus]|uniref:EI24 domain-containing protein n=1 Tax=Candidatus Pseudobacter hemicellulosilyticus TaxID=3121375 RepID=A0AAJ6BHG9_9BACT|nr:MAG: EI24 domain-containing protein [Pseudobacter sp.]
MLKEIVIAVQSYFRAHRFISNHRMWKWILIPGILYTLLFMVGMYFFWISSDNAVTWLSHRLGIDRWLHRQSSGILSFFFMMGELMIRLILVLFYFSLFKYLFLIIGSPLFAYLSEKTDAMLTGKDFPFSTNQLLKDMGRGIRLSLRNTLWQTVYMVSLLILSFIPLVGWIVPVVAIFVECYYYGFSMLDYSCERHKLSPTASIDYIGKHKGLAIGNGMVFYLMHLVPFLGWVLAPSYAVIAATISLYHQEPTADL